jgi:integrase
MTSTLRGCAMPSDGNAKRTEVVRVADNTFYALCRDFKASAKFNGYSKATQDLWGREMDFACRPNCLGSVSLDVIRPALIQGYLDGWDDKPGKQAAALAVFKAIERWAVVRDLLSRPITLGVETGRPEGGHIPWNDTQVECAERYARPDLARAITLGACTGQRISDLVRMGPTDLETYKGRQGINVTQRKTGRQVWIPVTAKLAAAMEVWERRPGPFLLRDDGKPWVSNHLTDRWDYEKKINPQLAEHRQLGLVLHGLRGYCCVRLSREGLNDHQISDLVGLSIPMVSRYTRLSNQKDNVIAAIDGTLDERRRQKFNIVEKSGS